MRHFIKIIIISFLALCNNCTDNKREQNKTKTTSIQILDFDAFQIKAPTNWYKIELKGIDSYVGGISDGIDTLVFDYGRYSSNLSEDFEQQLYSDDTINGKVSVVTKPKIKGKANLVVYFPDIDVKRFNLYTHATNTQDTIISIFQSITFKTSDTTTNSRTLKFEEREF